LLPKNIQPLKLMLWHIVDLLSIAIIHLPMKRLLNVLLLSFVNC
jgi:hypothetical protein